MKVLIDCQWATGSTNAQFAFKFCRSTNFHKPLLVHVLVVQLILLSCFHWPKAEALQLQTLDIYPGNGEECALMIEGPGRSSLYDYAYRLFRRALL